jgi:rhodanese-related sulfurtransferase
MMDLRKASWLPGIATILAILACYGMTLIIGLLSMLGIALAVNERAWAGAISLFAALAAIAIAASYRRHRSVWPIVIVAPGLALILWAMYGSYSRSIELAGFVFLIVAALLDWRAGRTSVTTDEVLWISPADLDDWLLRGSAPVIIDVRGSDEFTGPLSHIPNALNLPVGELPKRLGELNALKGNRITLVCRTDRRSAAASAVLRRAGFRDIHVLQGGMERWNQEYRSIASRPLQPNSPGRAT